MPRVEQGFHRSREEDRQMGRQTGSWTDKQSQTYVPLLAMFYNTSLTDLAVFRHY